MNAPFSKPAIHFSDTDAKAVGDLIANASDIALVVDRDGVVVDAAGSGECLMRLGVDQWTGRRLEALSSESSLGEISKLLALSPRHLVGHECTITHETRDGQEVVIRYTAVFAGSQHTLVLLGRDLSPLRSLQDRFLNAQQSMELSIERHRNDEARYRMVFQIGSEPIVVVDAGSGKIAEVNRAAGELLGLDARTSAGRRFSALFRKSDRASVDELVSATLKSGSATTDEISLDGQDHPLSVKATLLRTGESVKLLVQLKHAPVRSESGSPELNLVSLIHRAAEAVVLTDEQGDILWGNTSFVDLIQGGGVDLLVGQSLKDFFSDAELDIGLTLDNVRRNGRIKYIAARLHGATGRVTDVELSVVSMPDANPPCFGIIIRSIMPRAAEPTRTPETTGARESVEDLVGRVPLKELVREEIDVVEKNCIETALRLTGDNRAATAKVLGLSRQGLYTKMRRYGLLSEED